MKKIILFLATCFTLSAFSQTTGSTSSISGTLTSTYIPVAIGKKKIANSNLTSYSGSLFLGNNTPLSVSNPIGFDLGGQYSNVNGLSPKLIIYNN